MSRLRVPSTAPSEPATTTLPPPPRATAAVPGRDSRGGCPVVGGTSVSPGDSGRSGGGSARVTAAAPPAVPR